jgi:hypothetical protein
MTNPGGPPPYDVASPAGNAVNPAAPPDYREPDDDVTHLLSRRAQELRGDGRHSGDPVRQALQEFAEQEADDELAKARFFELVRSDRGTLYAINGLFNTVAEIGNSTRNARNFQEWATLSKARMTELGLTRKDAYRYLNVMLRAREGVPAYQDEMGTVRRFATVAAYTASDTARWAAEWINGGPPAQQPNASPVPAPHTTGAPPTGRTSARRPSR